MSKCLVILPRSLHTYTHTPRQVTPYEWFCHVSISTICLYLSLICFSNCLWCWRALHVLLSVSHVHARFLYLSYFLVSPGLCIWLVCVLVYCSRLIWWWRDRQSAHSHTQSNNCLFFLSAPYTHSCELILLVSCFCISSFSFSLLASFIFTNSLPLRTSLWSIEPIVDRRSCPLDVTNVHVFFVPLE